jgi:hypothetical protein
MPGRWRLQPADEQQDIGEHLLQRRELGHLDGDIAAAMAYNSCANLGQLLAQTGQRPRLRCLGHRKRADEIPEDLRERVKLEADGVGGKGAA